MPTDARPGHRWFVEAGSKVPLTDDKADSTKGAPGDKAVTTAATATLLLEMADLDERLWAERRHAVLIVFQAIDAGGKDGTIRRVFSGLNPAAVRVSSFKQPTPVELAHDFLWRVHAVTPAKGEIGIFNRSHYEDVLVTRVHHIVDEATCVRRYGQIRAFEDNLVAEGTTILKFFLHISKEEQRRRLQDRVDSPDERWKFSLGDLPERALWKEYMTAFADALSGTTSETAPWFVIPGDHKWYRDWAVASTIVDTLRALDPQYPPAEEGVEGVVVT
jgi:PPK2 family polyphosphate:nucleotide phosphotransferase